MTISRRRFAFWVGLGLFSLANKLRVYALDELAAALLDGGFSATAPPSDAGTPPLHWRVASNGVWRWFERERWTDGKWTLSGITTPVNVKTGEPYRGHEGYLDLAEVPTEVRRSTEEREHEWASHHATDKRRARHGRPPSKWLRSLHADELRIWLNTIDVPEADVVGMTYWEHLTRDHSFDPANIEGLVENEQAKLHAAAALWILSWA